MCKVDTIIKHTGAIPNILETDEVHFVAQCYIYHQDSTEKFLMKHTYTHLINFIIPKTMNQTIFNSCHFKYTENNL